MGCRRPRRWWSSPMGNPKERAFELYKCFHERGTEAPTEEEFDEISRCLYHHIRMVVTRQVFECSNFDLDDYMAEAMLLLWQRICQRVMPVQSIAMFIGALTVMTRQMLIDQYRKDRTRNSLCVLQADTGMEFTSEKRYCVSNKVAAAEMLKKHQRLIAKLMAKRSRFSEVNVNVSSQLVMLFQKNAKLPLVLDVLERTGYWDPRFLLEHIQVLYRWCYYDVREQILGLAA